VSLRRFYNRHGISQNPTAEESALLRKLWAADDARNRAHYSASRAATAEARISILEAENVALRAVEVAARSEHRGSEPRSGSCPICAALADLDATREAT
jgi:hypothetical protein